MFVSLAVSHFFWAAALPLVEASTAHLTRAQPGRYSRVRVWGSIGFVCLAMSGGLLLDGIGIGNLPWALCALLALVAVAAWRVPEVAAERKGTVGADSGHAAAAGGDGLVRLLLPDGLRPRPLLHLFSIGLKQAAYEQGAIGMLWGWAWSARWRYSC